VLGQHLLDVKLLCGQEISRGQVFEVLQKQLSIFFSENQAFEVLHSLGERWGCEGEELSERVQL